jgi:hypothetical protein
MYKSFTFVFTGPCSTMDSTEVSEATDSGSIPDEATFLVFSFHKNEIFYKW